jgi:hypothetical protein
MELQLMTERTNLTPLALADVDVALEMFTDPDVTKSAGRMRQAPWVAEN